MRLILALSIVILFAGSARAGMYTALLNDESTASMVGCTATAQPKAVGCHGAQRTPILSKLFAPRACSAKAAPKVHGCSAPRAPIARTLGVLRSVVSSCAAAPRATCAAAPKAGGVVPPPIKK